MPLCIGNYKIADVMSEKRPRPDPPREPPDMARLMARLALIRAEVEREDAPRRFPVNLVRMLLVLLALVAIPFLLTGPCRVPTGSGDDSQPAVERAPVTPRPGQ